MLKVKDICVEAETSILACLEVLDKYAQGIVFVLENGKLVGSLTDGDIRRALINGANKNNSISPYYNKEVVSFHVNTLDTEVQNALSEKIKIIPLLDDDGKVVDFASKFRMHRYTVMEPLLGGNELEYVTDCIKTNWISSQGSYVNKFQEMLKKECKANYCLATSNGTVSLHLALVSLGIGAGDEVIVPNLTFGASVNSIIHAGATPVLVDVDIDTWNMSTQLIRNAITSKTKAIMPVHVYGNPCDMENIMGLAKECNLLVIEDCAEALGASIGGRPVGSFGDAAAFSFFANKVSTCGEGGAVMFKDADVYQKAQLLRDHGMSKSRRYWHEDVGYNYRLTNIQAAIGCAQLEQIDSFKKRRMEIFDLYDSLLMPSGFFVKQYICQGVNSSYWLYTICLKSGVEINRDVLVDKLQLLGIDTRFIFYPMSEMPAFTNVKKSGDLNVSIDISYRGLSLPSSVTLKENEIQWISKQILNILENMTSISKVIQ
jgi:perosamine synthetase